MEEKKYEHAHHHEGEGSCTCHPHKHEPEHKHEHKHEHEQHHHEHPHCHGNSCSCHDHEHHHDHSGGCCCCEEGIERLGAKEIILYIVGAVLLVLSFLPMLPEPVRWVCAGLVYVAFGITVWKEMIEGFLHKRIFTEFTLMCVAGVGAIVLLEYADAAAVMYLYSLGESISGLASGRARKNIGRLISITPEEVTVLEADEPHTCHPNEVAVGRIVLVRAGERIALDGVVHAGSGSADTSSVTGEEMPAELTVGERCLSGSVLTAGSIEVLVTHTYDNSIAAKLKEAVEVASRRKALTEKRITRLAAVVTPAAFVLFLAVFAIGALVTGEVAEWFRRGLTILVCSCPCSLILSIPLTYFAGIGSAAGKGIVFRGGEVVDNMARLDTVLFDKTGTLTEPTLCFDRLAIDQACRLAETKIEQIAYSTLFHSPHVAAQTWCRAMQGRVEPKEAEQVEILPGLGVRARVDGHVVLCGNARLLADVSVMPTEKTAIHLAMDGEYLGALLFSSYIKEGAPKAIRELRACGVSRMALLSGDAPSSVKEVAEAVGIEEVYAGMMPDEKLSVFEKVYEQQKDLTKGTVAFCGDGLNDSAVIAASDVGIAMGQRGAAVTVEAADVILMDDDPGKLPKAVHLARRIVRIANQNIAISFGLKIGIATICVLVLPSMELALIADVGAAVITVLNAMRAGRR